MSQFFKVETTADNVRIVTFDTPGKDVNVLNEPVVRELSEVVEDASRADLKGVVFISGKKDFVLGADINEIAQFNTIEDTYNGSRALQEVFNKIGAIKCPTVAAIHGQALGGGLEFALACSHRIASDSEKTKLALPEIQLGLVPGAGGTQRLPRLIGIQGALDMILTGKRIAAKKALKMGLVDACVYEKELRRRAVDMALKPPLPTKPKDFKALSLKWATEGNALGRRLVETKANEEVAKSTKGFYPAPVKALRVIFDGYDRKLEKGLDLEARAFAELAHTRESKSLVHLFHATTAIKKNPYAEAGKKVFGDEKVSLIGVIGSGFMGAGIAAVAADNNVSVRLSDPSKESTARALKNARDFFYKKVKRKRLKPFEADSRLAQISPGTTTAGFSNCEVVIEAVFEDLKLKQKLLAEVESLAHEKLVFASNTSALPIAGIAANAKHPERVLGMHFFSPVEKMPLLEIVVTDKTAPWASFRAVQLGQAMGKQVIVVKDSPGFYTTRALAFFLAEAVDILASGSRIQAIDKALTSFGFPVGPITLIDEVGIDVGAHVLETMHEAFSSRIVMPQGIKSVQESGRMGRKNNKGFYKYIDGKKQGEDEDIYNLISPRNGGENLSSEDIVERCLLVFINESVRCLEEGILSTAYDGDVGAVFGLGFPPFWGGPFKYIDHLGADAVVKRLEALAAKYGERFKPAASLISMAHENKKYFPEEK